MRSLISGLAGLGAVVHVFTHRSFAPHVERAGGVFFDLFSKYPLESADDESLPVPCRFVTFAGTYAEPIRRDVEKTRPRLVIHDGFAVIGRVVADLMGIPRVNVCAGHSVIPERFLAILEGDPRVRISPRCLHAVDALRNSYGMNDATPFSYVDALSPHLNLYCEPPEFLDEGERRYFEPVAFYGSLPSHESERHHGSGEPSWPDTGSRRNLRVYVSFGTVVWRYYAEDALRALACLAEAFAHMRGASAIMSLGGTRISGETLSGLSRPGVSVVTYLDQWRVLQEADAFVTHHGMNSTHEAIFHRVPMISYPFFWDQPGLAAKCREFGLAIPLADSPRGPFGGEDVHAVLKKLVKQKESMRMSLSRAREWERAVIADRPAVIRRMMELTA